MLKKKVVIIVVATLIVLIGAGYFIVKAFSTGSGVKTDGSKVEYKPISRNDNSKFAFNIFSEISKPKKQDNIFISPTSISLAFLLAYNGAEGETRQEIEKALGLEGRDLEKINMDTLAFMNSLNNSDPGVKLNIANSVWAREDNKLLGDKVFKSYCARVKKYLMAEVNTLDFKNAADSARVMNNWVDEKTNHKIPAIINEGQIDDKLMAVLINAIYFNGKWAEAFDKSLTRSENFYGKSGKTKCDMMNQYGDFAYYEDKSLQLVKLPYGKGQQSMYVFLPAKGQKIDNFIDKLNEQKFSEWITKMKSREGTVKLPKFKMECSYDNLKEALEAVGIKKAFTDYAEFGSMSASIPLKINKVIHKSYIEVDESGTEAAAATAIMVRETSSADVEKPKPFNMVVDRPFFFVIRDNPTGNILFMGAVKDIK